MRHIERGREKQIEGATSLLVEMCTDHRTFIEDIDVLGSGHEDGRTIDMSTDHQPYIADIDMIGSVHEEMN